MSGQACLAQEEWGGSGDNSYNIGVDGLPSSTTNLGAWNGINQVFIEI